MTRKEMTPYTPTMARIQRWRPGASKRESRPVPSMATERPAVMADRANSATKRNLPSDAIPRKPSNCRGFKTMRYKAAIAANQLRFSSNRQPTECHGGSFLEVIRRVVLQFQVDAEQCSET